MSIHLLSKKTRLDLSTFAPQQIDLLNSALVLSKDNTVGRHAHCFKTCLSSAADPQENEWACSLWKLYNMDVLWYII